MINRSSHISIGLVLPSVPGYSETFFRNKIRGLQENGFKVVLFVENNDKKSPDIGCEIIVASKSKVIDLSDS